MGGLTGILLVVIVALILMGSHKLPDIGSGLGRGIKNFKRDLKEPDEIDVTPRPVEKKKENKPQ